MRGATLRRVTDPVKVKLRAGRPSAADRSAEDVLRAEVAAAPPPPSGGTDSERAWADNRRLLRGEIASKDPRTFLDWLVLRNTMVADAPYITDVELPALRRAGWLPLIAEDRVGGPAIIPDTSTSPNLAHHAYHVLRFREATGAHPVDFADIVEVGAGYGSMCRLLHRLTLGQARFTLLDLPEFSALQRYFLALVGVDADLVTDAAHVKPPAGNRLLVATWSLSEMPVTDRAAVLDAVGPVDAYLFGFQDAFGEAKNDGAFRALTESIPDVDWTLEPIGHIPGSSYLFGVRR